MATQPASWKDLAIRAIDCVSDAERETNWGSATFGDSVWERLRNEQNELLHRDTQSDACGPFVSLTMPLAGFEPQPIFIHSSHVREVRPRWVRKTNANGAGTDAHDLIGSWVTTGNGEDGTFPVCESYTDVVAAIAKATGAQ